MSEDLKMYVPSGPLPAPRSGILTPFNPGTQTLKAGFQIAPQFLPLPVDIIFEKDVAVTLRDGTTVYVDVFRPVGSERIPVIVAYSPYGKAQSTSPSVTGIFALVGIPDSVVSGLEKFEGPVIYRETRAQELVDLLYSYPQSPWFQRINMLGESGLGRRMVSQAA